MGGEKFENFHEFFSYSKYMDEYTQLHEDNFIKYTKVHRIETCMSACLRYEVLKDNIHEKFMHNYGNRLTMNR